MELLTTKIICLTLLGTLSLFFGLLPLKIRKYLMQGSKKRERITSYLLCFGGGVLLATVFIHMLPETREGFESAFANQYITAGDGYPMAELAVCAGFFLIYGVEEFVHKLTRITGADKSSSSSSHGHHHHHHHHHHHRHGHNHSAQKMEHMENEKPRRESGRCSVYSITEAVKKASAVNPPEAFSTKTKWAESGVDNPVFAGDADATSWNPALKDAIVTGSQVRPASNQDNTAENSDSAEVVSNGAATHSNGGVSAGHNHSNGGHSHSHNHPHSDGGGHGHSHMEIGKLFNKGFGSNLRSIIIVLALSIHSVFEGLAVGLQERVNDVWYLFGAIAAHKFVIAFCLGIKLLTSMSMGLMVIYMVIFALVSPMGIAIGILVTESVSGNPGSHLLLVTILQGLAGGTILYVTFFEILERERAKDGGRLLKLLFVTIGFATMACVEAFGGHSHGPSGEGGHGGHSHGGHSHGGHAHSHDHMALATTPFGDLLKAGDPSVEPPFGHDHHHDHDDSFANAMEEKINHLNISHDDHVHGTTDTDGDHEGHNHGPMDTAGSSHDDHDHGSTDTGSHDDHNHGPNSLSEPSGTDSIGDLGQDPHDEHSVHHNHEHDHGHHHHDDQGHHHDHDH